MKKHNPDNRIDNVENIQRNITYTIQNMRKADELIAKTSDSKLKAELEKKNSRRRAALESMRNEIKDEAAYKVQGREEYDEEHNKLI